MSSPTNIVVGVSASGTVKAAAYGQSEANASDLGFIKGGVNIEHEETSYAIRIDQSLAPIDKITTEENLKIKFPFRKPLWKISPLFWVQALYLPK